MTTDKYKTFTGSLTAPAFDAFAVTPSDSVNLPQVARALYVGAGGSVAVITKSGTTVTFAGVRTGSVLPVRVTRVLDTGTTADDIVGLV